MKTTHATGTLQGGMAPRARARHPCSSAQSAAINTAPRRWRVGREQTDALEREPASRRQDLLAAQQAAEILGTADAPLEALAGQRPHGAARGASRFWVWTPSDFCSSMELDPEATFEIKRLLTQCTRFRKNDVLYRVGDKFSVLYAIRVGSCKTVLLANDGQSQVAGFHMAGEVIGIDGIATDIHECEAIALEEMEVSRLPFDRIEHLARLSGEFGHALHKLLSQESTRISSQMIVLGAMHAEQRLAVLLLDLSQRYRARGYSSCELVLRMTREEIGSYLGLKLETVSRLFSRFQNQHLIEVHGRNVKLLDRIALDRLVGRDV